MNIKQILAGKFRRAVLFAFDCVVFACVTGAYYFGAIFFEHHASDYSYIWSNAGILLAAVLIARLFFGVYNSVWRYTRTLSYLKMVFADVIGIIVAAVTVFAAHLGNDIWLFAVIAPVNTMLSVCSRLFYRLIYKHRYKAHTSSDKKINVAIIGAGQLGAFLANELLCNHQSTFNPVFFIDKDPQKIGNHVAGLKVYPEDESVFELIKKNGITELFVAIAELDSEEAVRIFNVYSRAKCKLKIYDIPVKDFHKDEEEESEKKSQKVIRDFQIEDLLFRKPININTGATRRFYFGKTVLVTGGGGSIGSELCRQIAKCHPKKLIILDIYENNAYEIQQELTRLYGEKLDLVVEIASVRERDRLEAIFNAYRPQIVFHAAAHKHVPLMEHSGCEAIKNNVMGTYNTADMAEKYGAEKFILISTDKAVNPTNIMGASKRMCEMVVQCRTDSKTEFMAVRFGNVLGSNGSVIPLFRQQIKNGGPVTITDKRIIRYFMTIPEASQLVMQTGFMAADGELFVLDMGKPVKIYDLAVNMIKLSGFEPDVDIKIEEIGLRPGEKLYEELLIKTEHLEKTENSMIFIERDKPLSRAEVDAKLEVLMNAVAEAKTEICSPLIKEAIKKVVPTFREPEKVNKNAERSEEMKMTTV
ncbi:MAG: polysaccharide biosynthesis protein [Ruminococcaceae bacterium]|nr:polysaccharide biosynthesis protein [Oscillospiraceae bacterium]